ncbi:MAG: hypothetical protein HC825_08150, partial [Oscillatoriales cyanobacterium RM1_1_9]|nr:hypothetical protein [Oscillatoriales cyanobacterium RM1_1_9]
QTINIGAVGLPTITGAVVIDGWSSPNYGGAPVIELNGNNAGILVNGLTLGAGSDGSIVRGLVINRFSNSLAIQLGYSAWVFKILNAKI